MHVRAGIKSFVIHEDFKVVDALEYRYVCAVSSDNLHAEDKDKFQFGLFHIVENDWLTTTTTK